MINGEKVKLIPATMEDRKDIYEWCFHSETTKSHSGPPDFPEIVIPTFEEFCETDKAGYMDYYFTGEKPNDGRGFIITYNGERVGFISYSCFHVKPNMADLDIWMKSEAHCGKGLGVDSLVALSEYLEKEMNKALLILAPAAKNVRAVKAYEKAGFIETNQPMSDFISDDQLSLYGDGDYGVEGTAILIRFK